MDRRVLLLLPVTSYKAADFLAAAERLGIEVVVGSERRQTLDGETPGASLAVDPRHLPSALARIRELHARAPLAAIVGTDDETAVLAAEAARVLGLRHNPPEAVAAAENKHASRRRLRAAGLPVPRFRRLSIDTDPGAAAAASRYPVVLKPLGLSASRGVIRADDRGSFVRAFERIRAILADADSRRRGGDRDALLVEAYVPGDEVAVEGLLSGGRLEVLALFDKPDPLEGPTFEETIYVIPSRKPPALQQAIERETAAACAALGLCEGPVHAELRLPGPRPWVLEVAPRTIGGLCSRTLRFGAGVSLEELVLRHALGTSRRPPRRETRAAGVMMIPVPGAGGTLREVRGLSSARAIPGVEEVTLTVHRGASLVPLPEGHRYPGFIVARGDAPDEVEAALREAHRCLRFEFE